MRSCGAPSREAALDVLVVRNLVWLPNIHIYLNSVLRHKKVGGTPSLAALSRHPQMLCIVHIAGHLPSWDLVCIKQYFKVP
jgi:hypothetical protein